MNNTYAGPDRRENIPHLVLTDDQLEKIADKAAEKAVEKITENVYKQVGKGIIHKLFWVVGAIATAAYLYLSSKGFMK